MKIDQFQTRTVTNPLAGVTFDKVDKDTIARNAQTMARLDATMIMAIRYALARQSMYLQDVGDWTTPGTDQDEERRAQLEITLLAYQATYEAKIVQQFALVK